MTPLPQGSMEHRALGGGRVHPTDEPGLVAVGVGRSTLHRFPYFPDERGSLTVAAAPVHFPFIAVRMFQVYGVPAGELRGDHAHQRCHQLLIVNGGSVNVTVDDGQNRAEVVLNHPTLALHIPPMVWGIQHQFSTGAVLVVLASEHYDRAEYVDDYDEYLRLQKAGNP